MSTTAAAFYHAQNATLQAQEHKAKTVACKSLVSGFDSKTATVEQSQDYARCINHLYPSELSSVEAVMLKVAIVFCLACAAFGARHFWKRDDEDWFSALMGFFIGMCFGFVTVLVLAAVILSVLFLFT